MSVTQRLRRRVDADRHARATCCWSAATGPSCTCSGTRRRRTPTRLAQAAFPAPATGTLVIALEAQGTTLTGYIDGEHLLHAQNGEVTRGKVNAGRDGRRRECRRRHVRRLPGLRTAGAAEQPESQPDEEAPVANELADLGHDAFGAAADNVAADSDELKLFSGVSERRAARRAGPRSSPCRR